MHISNNGLTFLRIGATAFSASTLLRRLNAADIAGVAGEFLKWKRAGNNPDTSPLPPLWSRHKGWSSPPPRKRMTKP